jgi:hypothetical protein
VEARAKAEKKKLAAQTKALKKNKSTGKRKVAETKKIA